MLSTVIALVFSAAAAMANGNPVPCTQQCQVTYQFCIGQGSNQNCVAARDSCLNACPSTSTTSSAPAPTTTSHAIPCTQECQVTYQFCIGQNSNQNCVIARDSCLNACPASTTTSLPAPTTTSHAIPCTQQCQVTYQFCIGQNSNQNCVAARDSCLNACPHTSSTTVSSVTVHTTAHVCSSCPGPVIPTTTQKAPGPVVTAGAANVRPVLFLAGLGAIALL